MGQNGIILQQACFSGNIDMIKLLIKHGADVTVGNNAAIQIARIDNNEKVIELLIQHGAK